MVSEANLFLLIPVTSFGTEGRSPNVVPGSNSIIPSRTFHRSDIEELVVQQDAPAAAPAENNYDYHVRMRI